MKKVLNILERVYFFFPIQLVVVQFRAHKLILLLWGLLLLMVGGSLGRDFGIPFLFLEPEYLGEMSIWSMFLMGIGLGTFIGAYQIATYILDSYRFHFLALERRPFLIFTMNNFLLPLSFIGFYVWRFTEFQIRALGGFDWKLLAWIFALLSGVVFILMVMGGYFFKTNKNFIKILGPKFAQELKRPGVILKKAKVGINIRYRVDDMLTGRGVIRPVDKSVRADFRSLVRVLNQNHGNALLLELILLLVIMLLGLLDSNPLFQIPSGMSIMLLSSIFLMFFAAFTFWFRKIGIFTVLLLLLAVFALDRTGYFTDRHPAFGMNYETPAKPYTEATISAMADSAAVADDYHTTLEILEKWKQGEMEKNGGKKPRAVFLCVSGGGLRSTYFTTRMLQVLDSLSSGNFMHQTRLITGASGGMVGAAYYRELYLRRKLQRAVGINSKKYADRTARDLLNRISFRIVTGFFLPNLRTRIGDNHYPSDRGFAFDDQLMKNLRVFDDTRLADYILKEKEAMIPMMVYTPVLINDGRKLYISSTRCSYLCRNTDKDGAVHRAITGIEFRRFFKEQDADSLLYVTALRMQASFPMITPYVQLPSDPPLNTIDAGVVDNFGILTAMKFLYVFRDWFHENTDGVMIVQIRDSRKKMVRDVEEEGIIGKIVDPIGATYSSYSMSKDVAIDDNLDFSQSWYRGSLQMKTLQYTTEKKSGKRATLNWHLTANEKKDIDRSVTDDENLVVLKEINNWLRGK